jgi:tetratricopeptide (TPR) repeat protein
MNRQLFGLAAFALTALGGILHVAAAPVGVQGGLATAPIQTVSYTQSPAQTWAAEEFGQPIRIEPEQAEAFYKKALTHLRAGKYDEAIDDYDRVILSYPEFTPALINRGAAYAATGRYDRAIEDYSRAIRVRPDGDAFYNRALAFQRKGDHGAAVSDFTEALRLKQGKPEIYDARGMANMSLGRLQDAVEDFSQAIQLKPTNADSFQNRGTTYSSLGRYDSAMSDFNEAIRLNPKARQAFAGRGRTEFVQGNFEAASADLKKALSLRPDDAYLVLWTALALGQTGEDYRAFLDGAMPKVNAKVWPGALLHMLMGRATAEETLARAESEDPAETREQRTEAYFYIGQYNLLMGKKDEAAQAFRAALAQETDALVEYRGAQSALARLEAR